MVISKQKKFIFIIIAKNCSSTLRHRLKVYNSYFDPQRPHDGPGIIAHNTWTEFFEVLETLNIDHNNYFKFTFVRTPYDRIYTAYQEDFKRQPQSLKNVLLDQYVREFTEHNNIWRHAFLQHNRTHYEGNNMMDFIGHVERFETDFQKVCEILKLDDIELNNANVRTEPKSECDPHNMMRGDYKYLDKYTRRSIEIVNECYAKDFEYFGYQMLDPQDFPEELPVT